MRTTKPPRHTLAHSRIVALFATALSLAPSIPAMGAEVTLEGFYRARGRLYDNLSLDPSQADAEGTATYLQHRLWFRPNIHLNDKIALFTDVVALENLVWGTQPNTLFNPTAIHENPLAFGDAPAPVDDDGNELPYQNIRLWRAWSEIVVGDHRFSFGRMPLHWGMGIWQNDGLGLSSDFGDSADRVQWEGLFGNVFASLALDVNATELINQPISTTSFNATAAWRTELLQAGLYLQLRHIGHPDTAAMNLFTVDGSLDAEAGPVDLHVEGITRAGRGDFEGVEDVGVFVGGAVLDATLHTSVLGAHLTAGFASGDGDLTDTKVKTFFFDRDYNLGILMFEQPMPLLASATPSTENGGRNFDEALTSNAVSNAIFLRPRVSRTFFDHLGLEGSMLWARAAKLPNLSSFVGRRSYGFEFDVSASYEGLEHFDLVGTFAVMLPGSYYEASGLEVGRPVLGAQVNARVRF